MSAASEGAAGETSGAAATKAQEGPGAPRDRRGLRRACAARRLHRPDLHHAAALAGRVRHRLRGAGAVAHLLFRHDGEPANSVGAAFRAARRAAGARGGHGAVGHRLSRRGRERRFLDTGDRAFDRRARLQHAASARFGAGRPRLRRAALDEGARHLQFRRRHRQDVGAGAGLADAGGACRGSRPSRLSACSASSWRSRSTALAPRFPVDAAPAAAAEAKAEAAARVRRAAATASRCCCRSAWSTAPPAWAS